MHHASFTNSSNIFFLVTCWRNNKKTKTNLLIVTLRKCILLKSRQAELQWHKLQKCLKYAVFVCQQHEAHISCVSDIWERYTCPHTQTLGMHCTHVNHNSTALFKTGRHRRRTAQRKHTVKINSHKSDHRKRQMSNWSCFSGKHLLPVISVHVTWLCIDSSTILQLVWQCCSVVCLYKSTAV